MSINYGYPYFVIETNHRFGDFWTFTSVAFLFVIASITGWLIVDRPSAVASGVIDWVTAAILLWAPPYFLSR